MVITCKLRDVSQAGARLKVGESFLIPHSFLVNDRLAVRGDEVGIKFSA